MKIRVMSDLHLEFYEDPQACGIFDDVACDVVVLAGDIALGTRAIRWAAHSFPATPVVYVLGNHEYYGHDAAELLPLARSVAESSGVHLLENDELRIGGVRFLGCTLWTDFALGGDAEGAQRIADTMINDFRSASHRGRRLTQRDIVLWHEECVFRSKPATDSTARRPPIPGEAGHRFRCKPATPLRGVGSADRRGMTVPVSSLAFAQARRTERCRQRGYPCARSKKCFD